VSIRCRYALTVLDNASISASPFPSLTTGDGKLLDDFDRLGAVYDTVGVEGRETGDGPSLDALGEKVEILVGSLESKDNGVCRESSESGVYSEDQFRNHFHIDLGG